MQQQSVFKIYLIHLAFLLMIVFYNMALFSQTFRTFSLLTFSDYVIFSSFLFSSNSSLLTLFAAGSSPLSARITFWNSPDRFSLHFAASTSLIRRERCSRRSIAAVYIPAPCPVCSLVEPLWIPSFIPVMMLATYAKCYNSSNCLSTAISIFSSWFRFDISFDLPMFITCFVFF